MSEPAKASGRSDGAPLAARSGSLTDEAYSIIRRRIVTCDLNPGDVVTENKLAADIGLGKAPTRDALARLASEGIVIPLSRRGYEVLPLTIRHVSHLFETWRVIVCEAAAMIAIRADPKDKVRLRERSRMWAPAVPEDPETIRKHLEPSPFGLLFELTGNPIFEDMAGPVATLFERLMNFALLQGSWAGDEFRANREEMLALIDEGDADGARRAMSEMVDFGEREVMVILQRLDVVMSASLSADRL